MIETKQEYINAIVLISDPHDSIGNDMRETIEALREVARALKGLKTLPQDGPNLDWSDDDYTPSQIREAIRALNALPDWLIADG